MFDSERSASEVKKKGKLTIQCDEIWSFVGFKGNKQWIWLAIDVSTKEIVGVYIGKRDETGASPIVGFSTGSSRVNVLVPSQTFVLSYGIVFPKKRHKSVGKETGKTSYIERFNNTMRQRISRASLKNSFIL